MRWQSLLYIVQCFLAFKIFKINFLKLVFAFYKIIINKITKSRPSAILAKKTNKKMRKMMSLATLAAFRMNNSKTKYKKQHY